ncbi:MAG: hypothetical protein ACR2RL_22120 [Gammaproteobacteria bacterium]
MRTHLLSVVAGIVAMTTVGAAQADEIVARLSYHWAPKHPSAIQSQSFADAVNARLKGQFRTEVYSAGQLFGIREIMEVLAARSVELGGVVSFPPINRNYTVTAFPG